MLDLVAFLSEVSQGMGCVTTLTMRLIAIVLA